MKTRTLTGHSGCRVELIERDDKLLVRKTSKSCHYNQRLFRQCVKQQQYEDTLFRAPTVYHWSYEKGLFYFEMEYVNGLPLYEYVRSLDVNNIDQVARQFVHHLIPRNVECWTRDYAVLTKIASLQDRLAASNGNIRDALAMLNRFPWRLWSRSPCHGDLTFENIIYDRGRYYLIDFLDSFADSWLIDVAKLLQDLEVYWSYRNTNVDHNVRLRCHLLKNMVVNRILLLEHGFDVLLTVYHLLLLHLLRIVPYIRTVHAEAVVNAGIEKVMVVINQMLKEYGYGHVDNSVRREIDSISEHEAQMAAHASGRKTDDSEVHRSDGLVSF